MIVPFQMYDPQRAIDPETVVNLPAPVIHNHALDPAPATELESTGGYPNAAERVVRFIRDVLSAVALVMVIVVLVLSARFMVSVAAAIDQLRSTSAVTGCPFGAGQCGG